jgi:hypothetical protein
VGCPWMLIHHIRSYSPYLEAVSSKPSPSMRHVVVKRDPFSPKQFSR